jgi:hypothetical protein
MYYVSSELLSNFYKDSHKMFFVHFCRFSASMYLNAIPSNLHTYKIVQQSIQYKEHCGKNELIFYDAAVSKLHISSCS